MGMIKLCGLTILVLELLAILIHFEELLSYTGNVISAYLPIFIMALAMIWIIKKFFSV